MKYWWAIICEYFFKKLLKLYNTYTKDFVYGNFFKQNYNIEKLFKKELKELRKNDDNKKKNFFFAKFFFYLYFLFFFFKKQTIEKKFLLYHDLYLLLRLSIKLKNFFLRFFNNVILLYIYLFFKFLNNLYKDFFFFFNPIYSELDENLNKNSEEKKNSYFKDFKFFKFFYFFIFLKNRILKKIEKYTWYFFLKKIYIYFKKFKIFEFIFFLIYLFWILFIYVLLLLLFFYFLFIWWISCYFLFIFLFSFHVNFELFFYLRSKKVAFIYFFRKNIKRKLKRIKRFSIVYFYFFLNKYFLFFYFFICIFGNFAYIFYFFFFLLKLYFFFIFIFFLFFILKCFFFWLKYSFKKYTDNFRIDNYGKNYNKFIIWGPYRRDIEVYNFFNFLFLLKTFYFFIIFCEKNINFFEDFFIFYFFVNFFENVKDLFVNFINHLFSYYFHNFFIRNFLKFFFWWLIKVKVIKIEKKNKEEDKEENTEVSNNDWQPSFSDWLNQKIQDKKKAFEEEEGVYQEGSKKNFTFGFYFLKFLKFLIKFFTFENLISLLIKYLYMPYYFLKTFRLRYGHLVRIVIKQRFYFFKNKIFKKIKGELEKIKISNIFIFIKILNINISIKLYFFLYHLLIFILKNIFLTFFLIKSLLLKIQTFFFNFFFYLQIKFYFFTIFKFFLKIFILVFIIFIIFIIFYIETTEYPFSFNYILFYKLHFGYDINYEKFVSHYSDDERDKKISGYEEVFNLSEGRKSAYFFSFFISKLYIFLVRYLFFCDFSSVFFCILIFILKYFFLLFLFYFLKFFFKYYQSF